MPLASSDVDRFGEIPCQIGSTIVATAKTLMPNRYYDERKDFRIKSHGLNNPSDAVRYRGRNK